MPEVIERPELQITGSDNGDALTFELLHELPDGTEVVVVEVSTSDDVTFHWPQIQRMAADPRLSVRALAVALLAAREEVGYWATDSEP